MKNVHGSAAGALVGLLKNSMVIAVGGFCL